jgi:alpha,alpha-trehalase
MENYLSVIYNEQKDYQLSQQFKQLAEDRRKTIQDLFWNDETHFFMDYDLITNQHTSILSLAGVYPLLFNIATKEQAEYVQQRLREHFLKDGGLVTTLEYTGEQRDYPNGWRQLQFIAYQPLKNDGFHQLANEIRSRWLNLNDRIYQQTGRINEKYNVVVDDQNDGGGNYALQYGFGWTNGIYLKFRLSEN